MSIRIQYKMQILNKILNKMLILYNFSLDERNIKHCAQQNEVERHLHFIATIPCCQCHVCYNSSLTPNNIKISPHYLKEVIHRL